MLQMFQALMPKEDRFFDLFDRHAATLVAGARALRQVLDGGPDVAAGCQAVMEHENAADEVAREALLLMRRTFITPFDRGDIRRLVNALDDSIDQMQKTAKAITLFEVEAFEPEMRELGDLIIACAERTVEMVGRLKGMRRNVERLNALTAEVVGLETQSDLVCDRGMKALFLKVKGGENALQFIVGTEIYDHLEKVVDRFEDVANGVNGILIEHL